MSDIINYLVVNAPNFPPSDTSILIEPVDALTLATWIQHNQNDVVFVDLDRFGLNVINDLTLPNYKITLIVFDYLIPLYTSEAIHHFDNLFKSISKRTDYILLTGRAASYFPREILNRFPKLYGCVIGEPEIVLADLLKHDDLQLLKSNPDIITQENKLNKTNSFKKIKIENIYDLFPETGPISNRKLCQFDQYIDVHSIISSRGCDGFCKFCSTSDYLGSWRGASPKLVLSEIKHLVDLGAYKIIFLDDNFSNNQNRVRQICELIRKNKIDIVWGCLCRIVDVDENLLNEMHKSGCRWIHFGIEHGDPDIRLSVGKNFSNQDAIKIVQFAQKIGIRVRTSWILDLPEATDASIKKTFELAKKISSHEIKIHFLALRPGSRYYYEQLGCSKSMFNDKSVHETYIHKGQPHHTSSQELKKSIMRQLDGFRVQMCKLGYQWVPDVTFWKKFNNQEALPNEKFFSTSIMRYGLGWRK